MTKDCTLKQQFLEARREVRKRREVFPRLVASSSLTQERADELIALMEAIATTLFHLMEAEEEDRQPSLFGDTRGHHAD